jgi:hypothetical protein
MTYLSERGRIVVDEDEQFSRRPHQAINPPALVIVLLKGTHLDAYLPPKTIERVQNSIPKRDFLRNSRQEIM